jgi:hypothetical protein
VRFTFQESPDGTAHVEVETPNSNSKARGILTNTESYTSTFGFPDSDILYLNVISLKPNAPDPWMLWFRKVSPQMAEFKSCSRIDSPPQKQ